MTTEETPPDVEDYVLWSKTPEQLDHVNMADKIFLIILFIRQHHVIPFTVMLWYSFYLIFINNFIVISAMLLK